MPIGRSQIPQQIEGKLRGARDEKKKVKLSSKIVIFLLAYYK